MIKPTHRKPPYSLDGYVITDKEGRFICDCWIEEEAKFIAEACNNYERLKAESEQAKKNLRAENERLRIALSRCKELEAENQRLRDLLRKAVDTIQYDGTGISLRSNIWDMLNEIEKALQQEGEIK